VTGNLEKEELPAYASEEKRRALVDVGWSILLTSPNRDRLFIEVVKRS
jgi:hypothetical protein